MPTSLEELLSALYSAPHWPPLSGDVWPVPWPPRYRAVLALVRDYGASAVGPLCQILADASRPDPMARVAAANALRMLGPVAAPAVEVLARNLAFPDPAPELLGPLDASSYSGSPAMWVRWSALTALAHVGSAAADATPALLSMLKGEHEASLFVWPGPVSQRSSRVFELRGAAAWLLQRLVAEAAVRDPRVIPALCAALADPTQMVRLNALAALGRVMSPRPDVIAALRAALRHPDERTRVAAGLAAAGLGSDAALLRAELQEGFMALDADDAAFDRLRELLLSVGLTPRARPRPPRPPRGWSALSRRDFLFVAQPYRSGNNDVPYEQLLDAFLSSRIANALTYWPEQLWYNLPLPSIAELRRWGIPTVWYFFTEDIFNPKLQRDWAYPTLTEYNRSVIEHLMKMGRKLGKDSVLWSVGHEHFDNLTMMEYRPDGTTLPQEERPLLKSKREGYEFYRRWITTAAHKLHWMNYGNSRPGKFFEGHDTGAPATWEFLEAQKIDTEGVTLMSGGTTPTLAHATFDILPRIDMFWWECGMDGGSLQIGVAYARGAGRQYQKKWLMDVTNWGPASTGVRQPSDEQLRRSWAYGYLAGADVVLQEASGETHFKLGSNGPVLTSTGKTAQEVAHFCFELCPDRGEPYQPVAVLLDHEHGLESRSSEKNNPRNRNPFGSDLGGAWGMLADAGDHSICRFWRSMFPGHTDIPTGGSSPPEQEAAVFTGSTLGDCFDVLTDHVTLAVLRRYPVVIVLGGWRIDGPRLQLLRRYVAGGGELILSSAHIESNAETRDWLGVSWAVQVGAQVSAGDPERPTNVAIDLFSTDSSRPVTTLATTLGPRPYPLITETQVKKGRVFLVSLRHFMAGIEVRIHTPWLPAVTALLRERMAPHWPLLVTTRQGAMPQVALNKRKHGWLVTIGNHAATPWEGTMQVKGASKLAVRELWTQAPIAPQGATVPETYGLSVPPFSFRTFGVEILPG